MEGSGRMIYSEAAYFDGNHCQHVADRDEHRRLQRKRQEAQRAFGRGRRINRRDRIL